MRFRYGNCFIKTMECFIYFFLFSSWDKRREYIRMVKADRKRKDLPKLKDTSHLISFPVQEPDGKSK